MNPDATARPRAALDADLLRRVHRTSMWLGLVLAAPLAFYFGTAAGAAWVLGAAWSLVNLRLIASIVRRVLTLEPRPWPRLVLALLLKFPLLYGAGFALLRSGRLSAAWLAAGFAWPFVVVVLKAAGRAALDLDRTVPAAAPPGERSR
jgi:hypothetical protein